MFIDSWECLDGLKSLRHLNLRGNKLTILKGEYETFKGMSKLETLDLSNNDLSWVTPDVFYSLISLISLHLDYNKLQGDHIVVW